MRYPLGAKLGLVRAQRADDGLPVHAKPMALTGGEFKPGVRPQFRRENVPLTKPFRRADETLDETCRVI